MIVVNDKHNCCGCGACSQTCPLSCVTMKTDKEGFCYPETDTDICTSCGLCETVCPMTGTVDKKKPENTFISYSSDETLRKNGSSGGMFQTIAQKVISLGGIVFGARFDDNWNVVHDYADNKEGITAFCGSKYLQSRIGNSFKQAELFLDKGKTVLFSGTPCQIHGLKKYLKKDYPNLITVDFVCHGVPSPSVWQSYIDFTARRKSIDRKNISSINFRDKCSGWKRYSVTIKDDNNVSESTPFNQNSYMQLFLRDYILRPSCYNCSFKNGANISDVTLGDFWGVNDIHPEWDDDKGLSVCLANSTKGAEILSRLDSTVVNPLPLQDCLHKNPSYYHSAQEPLDRPSFWNSFEENGYNGALAFLKSIKPSAFSTVKFRIKSFFRSLTHPSSL